VVDDERFRGDRSRCLTTGISVACHRNFVMLFFLESILLSGKEVTDARSDRTIGEALNQSHHDRPDYSTHLGWGKPHLNQRNGSLNQRNGSYTLV
jgi:hypothetical protein